VRVFTNNPGYVAGMRRLILCLLPVLLALSLGACSSVEFVRDTESSGTFVATGTSFTIFGVDVPRSALNQARENASDAGLHNMEVSQVKIRPYWGMFDFLLEIISVRSATIHGTWGYTAD